MIGQAMSQHKKTHVYLGFSHSLNFFGAGGGKVGKSGFEQPVMQMPVASSLVGENLMPGVVAFCRGQLKDAAMIVFVENRQKLACPSNGEAAGA
jgi:hypothetical protein